MSLIRVLIVDANEMFIEMVRFVLTAAADASRALLQIPAFLPELILMDVQMPGMDGIELTRRLKADPATQHIVNVAFTAFALKGDELGLRAAGFDGYVARPADVMTLAAELRFWYEGTASARGRRFAWP